jgi:hypothetical protein
MKKVFLTLFGTIALFSCTKHDLSPIPPVAVNSDLVIAKSVGIKLETPFVTSEVSMNVKTETSQTVTIKIIDISNRVVSKETVYVNSGDNILKVYTTALPSSAYRIALFDSAGNMLGITDFNKI